MYSNRKGYSFIRIAVICTRGLITGQMIGRWGNFTNQVAHGGDGSIHPNVPFRSLWSLAGLTIFLFLRRAKFLLG
ncbi:prolipoprotein diacylglyceryl transferase family protein [Paenibacillus sp. GCM10012303]|uniref:prolipoprotein diacylglyceryl transferase family protein n=1 Tax=Paenibacillus sp. GCM10012303 TaxID=3317340 RepID=UPI003623A2A2